MSRVIHDSIIDELRLARKYYYKGVMTEYERCLEEAAVKIRILAELDPEEDEDRSVDARLLELYTLQGEYIFIASLRYLREPRKLIPMYHEACRRVACLMSSRVVSCEEPFLPMEAYEDLFSYYNVSLDEWESFAQDLELAVSLYGEITGGSGAGTDRLFRAQAAWKKGDLHKAREMAGDVFTIAILSGFEWMESHAVQLLNRIEEKHNCLENAG